MSAPVPVPPPPAASDDYPGKTLGIVGLALAIVIPVVGFVLCIVAMSQSGDVKVENQFAKIGIVLAIVFFFVNTIGMGLVLIVVPALARHA